MWTDYNVSLKVLFFTFFNLVEIANIMTRKVSVFLTFHSESNLKPTRVETPDQTFRDLSGTQR